MNLEPIGTFHSSARYPYDVPRQGILASQNTGWIELYGGRNFESALEGLEGFSRIWIFFAFDRNGDRWHPKVQPPRHTDKKVGVFATRSPYRPNPIGLSCVELLQVRGRVLLVKGHDLLDGTPILDIKPYLPYADAFPNAKAGWTQSERKPQYAIRISATARRQLDWLAKEGVACLEEFLREQLSEDPLNPKRHRLADTGPETPVIAYRTWRARFQVTTKTVRVTEIFGGYTDEELKNSDDKYHDKQLHRRFQKEFPRLRP